MDTQPDVKESRRPRRWSRWFGVALMAAAVFFAVRTLAPQTVGETARRTFLSQLQRHYDQYRVSIGRGTFDPRIGLVFEDIRIADHSSGHPVDMIRVDRLTVFADIEPEKLLDQSVPLRTRRIVADGVYVDAWLTPDGEFSLASLLPLPKFGPDSSRIDLRRVKVRLLDSGHKTQPIHGEFDTITVVSIPRASGPDTKQITIQGAADFARAILARVQMTDGVTSLQCAIRDMHFNRGLFERLPSAWIARAEDIRFLQCNGDATVSVRHEPGRALDYRLRTTVHDGQLSHPSLPAPLSQLRGIVSVRPNGITIETARAMLSDTTILADGVIQGTSWPCDARIRLAVKDLLLDEQFAASLPDRYRQSWDKLQPHGRVDIDAQLNHQNQRWQTDATVISKGVDVRYHKFPYPVESLVGTITVKDGIAVSDSINGRIAGNRMQCAFRLPIDPNDKANRRFVIGSEGAIPIDQTLLNSLSPESDSPTALERFVRSLHPSGSVHLVSGLIETDARGTLHRQCDLDVINGNLQYDKFAYPLYNVHGRVSVDDRLVTLEGFRGTNGNGGTILCDGTYRIADKAHLSAKNNRTGNPLHDGSALASLALDDPTLDSQLRLVFQAHNVAMDDALRSAIPPSSQLVWDGLAPSGILDELSVTMSQQGHGKPLAIELTAAQRASDQVTSRTLSLRPTSLPYRIDVTGGRVHFDGSEVTIESIRGRHDSSTLAADGHCIRDPQGRWNLLLNVHSGSRLHPDAELIAAIPGQMRKAMRALQLRGPVGVRGWTRLMLPDAAHPDPAIIWDLALQLEGNRIGDVGPVHSLRGEISSRGTSDELGIRATGQVQIDSLHVYEIQIANIRGPYAIVDDRLYLGTQVTASQNRVRQVSASDQTVPLQGRVFDGGIQLDGQVDLSSGRFDVVVGIRRGQVQTLLADFGHYDNEFAGVFNAQSHLQGVLGRLDLLRGDGSAQLSGANLYKLPLIVKVLQLLSITPTEDVAFTDGEMRFSIYGESITFQDLQMWGDLVALQGGGTLDRRRQLDLTFNTRVSPQNSFTQILRPLRSKRYTLWTIDVHGPLHALEIERRALDGVGETLERLLPGASGHDVVDPASTDRPASLWPDWFR